MGTLELLAAIVAVPVLLLGLLLLFAWRYRRSVAVSMATRADAQPSAVGAASLSPVLTRTREARGVLHLRRREGGGAVPPGDAGRAALRYAGAQDAKVRLSFAAAGAVYWMLTAAALSWVTRDWPGSVLAMQAWLSALPVLVLVATFTTRSWRTRTAIGVVYLAIGAGLIPATGGLARWGRVVIALAELNALLPTAGLLPLLVHRLRPLLAALGAVIFYLAAGILLEGLWLGGRDLTEVTSGMRWSVTRMIPASILAHVAGIVLFFWALRRRWLGRTLGALIVVVLFAGALDRLLQPSFPLGLIAVIIPGAIVQLGLVWGAFKLLLWLQDRRILPAQVLHFHLAVGFLTLLMGWTLRPHAQRIGASAAVPWMALLAWAVAAVALHVALRCIRSRGRDRHVPRLLFLRVFGSAGKRERLLDLLDDSWRRVGRVDLVGGTDLSLRTLSARMLEAFLLRRVETGFLRTPEEVTRRLAHLDERMEGDARYPVNELYCAGDIWPAVVSRLAPVSDVVLMDLRGFTRTNRGCELELTEVIWSVPLARVLLLTDERTDELDLEQVVNFAWAELPERSPNASGLDAELSRIDLRGRSDDGERALVQALFRIVFGGPGASSPHHPSPRAGHLEAGDPE